MAYDIGPRIGIEGEAGFRKAINDINTTMRTLGTEMKAVASQFDKNDKSQEAYAAKNAVLNKQIDTQKKKLSELEKGLKAAGDKYGENDRVTQGWRQAVNKATTDLNNMERELKENNRTLEQTKKGLDDASKSAEHSGQRFEKLSGILKASAVAMGTVVAAAGAAAVKLGKEVIKQFGELEQNLGGSEAVFGDYAKSIQKIGEDAYKNMGVSQSQYLATANKMGALFQGSGIEQRKSMELTEKAMQRAADMASVMGIDMQMALDSVAGAAKGNFTMMDNLGVAMNATNIEAYALAKGLEFTWATASQAEKAEMAMQMFFENTEQYAGNFAKESTETITGSLGLLKAASASLVGGLGNANADIKNLTTNLLDAFQSVVKNTVPIIKNLVNELPTVVNGILTAVGTLLPTMLETVTSLFRQTLDSILQLLPELIPVVVEALMTVVGALIDNLPLMVNGAFMIIMALAGGLIDALPELIPVVVDTVLFIVDTILNNLNMLIEAAINIIVTLAKGLIDALPKLIEKIPVIVETIVTTIVDNLPLLIDAAIEIIVALVESIINNLPLLVEAAVKIIGALLSGMIQAIPTLLTAIPKIFTSIRESMKNINWGELGTNIITGIVNGVSNAAVNLVKSVKDAGQRALDGVKNMLGIKSPSKIFEDQVGFQIGAGMARGISKSAKKVQSALNDINKDITNPDQFPDRPGGSGAAGVGAIYVNVPLSIDGQIATKKTGTIQVRKNKTYSRAVGVMA